MPPIEFDDRIPLPIGAELKTAGRRVHANPLIGWVADDIQVHSTTESGWPTLVLGESEDGRIGVAVDYVGDWHESPVEEIDLLLTADQRWAVVVAYRNLSSAKADADYEVDGFRGFETHTWDPETHPETIQDCVERDVTPLFYTADAPDAYAAHAYQMADSYEPLRRLFGLSRFETIERRQERLFTLVVPREERWRDTDTGLRGLATELLDDDSDAA